MGAHLLHWLQSYGYIGLAIGVFLESMGVPVPGETALLAAAFAAAQGSLRLTYVIAIAAGAGILGDNLGYLLGRRLGRRWIERHGHRVFLPPERLARMERFFERFGPAAVAVARFIVAVRVVAAFTAGVARLRWGEFLAFNVLGAVVWATVMGLLGYAAGRGASAFGLEPWMIGAVVVGLIVVAAVGGVLGRRLKEPVTRWLAASWLAPLIGWELWALALSLSGLVLFAKMAEDVVHADSAAFDAAIRGWVLAHPSSVAGAVLAGVSWLGSLLVAVPLMVAAALWLWRKRHDGAGVVVVIAPILGSAFFLALKAVFQRGYPSAARLGPTPAYSFPSGHATTITAVAATLAYVLVRRRLVPWGRAAAGAVVLILLVGSARVCLDLDWASDVIGGWAVGLFVAAIAGTMYELIRTRPAASLHRGQTGRT